MYLFSSNHGTSDHYSTVPTSFDTDIKMDVDALPDAGSLPDSVFVPLVMDAGGWNRTKNGVVVGSDHAWQDWFVMRDFVHVDFDFSNFYKNASAYDLSVEIYNSKRGNIAFGDGNDDLLLTLATNGSGWSNRFNIDTGRGNDVVTIDTGEARIGGQHRTKAKITDGKFTTIDIKLGQGDDVFDSTGVRSADRVRVGSGNDVANTGAGDDYLYHGKGQNTLTGGAGADTFQFDNREASGRNSDTVTSITTITDFELGVDRLTFRMDNFSLNEQGDKIGYFQYDWENENEIHTRNKAQAVVSTHADIMALIDNIEYLRHADGVGHDNSVEKLGQDLVMTLETNNHGAFQIILEGHGALYDNYWV